MKTLQTFTVPGRKKFTGAILTFESNPYPELYISCHKNGRKYLKKANYLERKRIHKYIEDNNLVGDVQEAKVKHFLGKRGHQTIKV